MKYSEKIEQLEYHASSCQLAADEMAIRLIDQEKAFNAISVFQSKCDFNLSWLYQLSPGVILHVYSLEFLADNVKMFKRKLKVDEIVYYDFLINCNGLTNFDQFRKIINEK